MKKYFLFLLAANSLSLAAISQNVGIGTTNPLNKLHVAGGFRLDTLVHLNDSGLLRHNNDGVVYSLKFTGNVNDVLRGDGTFGAGSSGGGTPSNVWMLNGNSGTNPATDFIGTTDFHPLLFRVNNFASGLIHPLNGNTAFGYKTLYSNTNGSNNTANGSLSLYSNTFGSDNTANGYQALHLNTTGSENTATGTYALFANTTGYDNTANGYAALSSNTTGIYNTANGDLSLYHNTTGSYNTANGDHALFLNTTGSYTTANGYQALYSNTTGGFNTANGYIALHSNTSGQYNMANGNQALHSNTTGNSNTATGYDALSDNTTGSNNTGVGYFALGHTTTSVNNTAIGYDAGALHNLGYNNTFLGANCDANANDLFNCIAIGQGVTCTASSQARIGNSATNSIGGQVGWTTLSDERMKQNVQENVKGLEFIKLLRPVTYNIDANKVEEWFKKDETEKNKDISATAAAFMQKARNEKSKTVYTGFLAQDVAAAAKKIGYDFSGVDAPKNNSDLYGLRYGEFVVPLVKAVQEQQAIIEKQQQQIDELVKELQLIKDKIK